MRYSIIPIKAQQDLLLLLMRVMLPLLLMVLYI
nr:MAG TPA: hypothetical protein [Caudoviricetes sp.]DAP03488.1 MAG TPA: hypothetical protein [Caudoviricetes sp.]